MVTKEQIQEITEEHLKDFAATTLVDAVNMYAVGREVSQSCSEIVGLFQNTLVESVVGFLKKVAHFGDEMEPKQELSLAEDLNVHIRTIAAVALSLVPIYFYNKKNCEKRMEDKIN